MLSFHKLRTGGIRIRELGQVRVDKFLLQGAAGCLQLEADFFADSCLLLKKDGICQERGFFIREREVINHVRSAFLSASYSVR